MKGEPTDDSTLYQTYLFNSACLSSSKALRDVSEGGSTAVALLVMVSYLFVFSYSGSFTNDRAVVEKDSPAFMFSKFARNEFYS
jgi:hypothetical protein